MAKKTEIDVENASNKELIEMYSNTKKFIDFLDKASKDIEEE